MSKDHILSDRILFLGKEPSKPITVVYVPSHLYHMVFELFKVLWTVNCFLSHYSEVIKV